MSHLGRVTIIYTGDGAALPQVQSLDNLAQTPMELNQFQGPSYLNGPQTLTFCSRPRSRALLFGLTAAGLLSLAATSRAQAEAQLLIEASTGKVLHAENATYPWYPASVTKLMTAYTTLRAIKDGKVAFDTLLTMSRNAVAQSMPRLLRRLRVCHRCVFLFFLFGHFVSTSSHGFGVVTGS